MLFYMRLNDDRAKFLTLFSKAFSDSANFPSIFLFICIVAGLILYLMGARFDDGDNFNTNDPDSIVNPGYDTNFNDYPYVFGAGVSILGIVRNSVGDL